MKIIAMAAVAACVGILLWQTGHLSRDASKPPPVATRSATGSVAATPAAEVPEAFRPAPADARGTPGEAVAYHLAKGTPEAGLDAFRLIDSCQRSRAARACDGITPAMEQRAGELVAKAMAAGVHGAAAQFFNLMSSLPPEAFKELESNPRLREGVSMMVDALKVAVRESNDRSAISALSILYSGATPMVKRDPAAALVYVTALRELNPPHPALKASSDAHVAELVAELTPEQVKDAMAAGAQLARDCNCREG